MFTLLIILTSRALATESADQDESSRTSSTKNLGVHTDVPKAVDDFISNAKTSEAFLYPQDVDDETYEFPVECITLTKDGRAKIKTECVRQACPSVITSAITSAKNNSVSNASPRTNYFETYGLECFGGVHDGEILIDYGCNSDLRRNAFTKVKRTQEMQTQMAALLSSWNITEARESIFQRQYLSLEAQGTDKVVESRRVTSTIDISRTDGELEFEAELEATNVFIDDSGLGRRLSTRYFTSKYTLWAHWRAHMVSMMYAMCMPLVNDMSLCQDTSAACAPPNEWNANCAGHGATLTLPIGPFGMDFSYPVGAWHNGDDGLGAYGMVTIRHGNGVWYTRHIGPCGWSGWHATGSWLASRSIAFCGQSTSTGLTRLLQEEEEQMSNYSRRLQMMCR